MIDIRIDLANYTSELLALDQPLKETSASLGISPTTEFALFRPAVGLFKSLVIKETGDEQLTRQLEAVEAEKQQLLRQLSAKESQFNLQLMSLSQYSEISASSSQKLKQLLSAYFKNYKEILFLLKNEETILNKLKQTKNQPSSYTGVDWKEKIVSIDALCTHLRLVEATHSSQSFIAKPFTQGMVKVAQSAEEMVIRAAEIAEAQARKMIEESKQLKIFADSRKNLERTKKEYLELIADIETTPLTDNKLLSLQLKAQEILEASEYVNEQKNLAEINFKETIKNLIRKHPTATKAIGKTALISCAALCAMPLIAVPLDGAIDKLVEQLQPCDSRKDTDVETVAANIFQTASCFFIGGKTAALLSGGTAVLNMAPHSVKHVVESTATAAVASKAGFSPLLSLSLGASMMIGLQNSFFIADIRKDIKKGWKCAQTNPIKALILFTIFAKNEGIAHIKRSIEAIQEGKKLEAISRIASFALLASGLAFSFWTLPLALPLFYLTNKAHGRKYEGLPQLCNVSFRSFVIQEHNAEENRSLKTLVEILKEENEEFTPFCDTLERLKTELEEEMKK